MPKISIEDLMRDSPFPERKPTAAERLNDATSALRSNAADILDRLTSALPQPGNIPGRRHDRMTYGAWNLDDSESPSSKG
jgi:hypothetical protein